MTSKLKKTLSAENENRRVILTLMKEKEQMKKLTVTFPDSLALAARLRYHLSSGLGFESLPTSLGFEDSILAHCLWNGQFRLKLLS